MAVTAGLLPARKDFVVYQGSKWSHGVQFEDKNGDPVTVSASDFDGTVRLQPEGDTAVSLTIADDVDNSNGIVVSLTGSETAGLDTGPHVYDLYHSPDDRVLLAGHITVTAGRDS